MTPGPSTEAPSVIRTRLEPGETLTTDTGPGCGDQEARGIVWRGAGPGALVSRPCPSSTVGVAVRECRGAGRGWGPPHLGDCTQLWLTQVSDGYRGGVSVMNAAENIVSQLNR